MLFRHLFPALRKVRGLTFPTTRQQNLLGSDPSISKRRDAQWIKYMVAWTLLMEATSSAFASFVTFDYAYVMGSPYV